METYLRNDSPPPIRVEASLVSVLQRRSSVLPLDSSSMPSEGDHQTMLALAHLWDVSS